MAGPDCGGWAEGLAACWRKRRSRRWLSPHALRARWGLGPSVKRRLGVQRRRQRSGCWRRRGTVETGCLGQWKKVRWDWVEGWAGLWLMDWETLLKSWSDLLRVVPGKKYGKKFLNKKKFRKIFRRF